jgi:hypothetical protein
MAYAASRPEIFRRAATFVDKILRGTNPADPPIEQSPQFELVISHFVSAMPSNPTLHAATTSPLKLRP